MSSPINFREQELSHMVGTGTMASPVNFRDVVSIWEMTEFRQTIQVQSHLEMPGILVQLGHIQRT